MFQLLADFVTYQVFGLKNGTHFAASLNFFIYDTLKILTLIFVVISVIAFFRTFFAENKLKKMMYQSRFGLGNLAAAIFGVMTPFCSCSSIPIFVGFLKAEISLGVAFSFLITSPLVNEVAFVMMGGLFGWKLAFAYALSGVVLGVLAGMVLGALKMEKYILLNNDTQSRQMRTMPTELKAKIVFALLEGKKTVQKLFFYVLGGVALGAIVHGYVPQDFFENYIAGYSVFAVPVAVLLGIPIYAGCSTVVPLIFSITANGVPLGTSLAFMMSIAGLSLPEAIILKRVMNLKLLLTFFGIVGVGIVLIGYLFNFLEKILP